MIFWVQLTRVCELSWMMIVDWLCSNETNLCGSAQAARLLTGSHHQKVASLVALIIQRPGQADLSGVLLNAEKAAGIDQQAVAYLFLLEGNSQHHKEAVEQREGD